MASKLKKRTIYLSGSHQFSSRYACIYLFIYQLKPTVDDAISEIYQRLTRGLTGYRKDRREGIWRGITLFCVERLLTWVASKNFCYCENKSATRATKNITLEMDKFTEKFMSAKF